MFRFALLCLLLAGQLTMVSLYATESYGQTTDRSNVMADDMPFNMLGIFNRVPSDDVLLCHQPVKAKRCLEPVIWSFKMKKEKTAADVCSMASHAQGCIGNVSGTCGRESRHVWATVDRFIYYACSRFENNGFAQSYQCLERMSYGLSSIVKQCAYTKSRRYRRNKRTLSNPRQLCRLLDAYDECLGDEVESHCGRDARDFVWGFSSITRDFIKEQFHVVRCPGNKQREDAHAERPAELVPYDESKTSKWGGPFDTFVIGYLPSEDELLCHQPTKAKRCLEPIIQSFMMRKASKADDICRMALNAQSCIGNVSETCSMESRHVWSTAQRLVYYACRVRRNEFVQAFRCLDRMSYRLPVTVRKCLMPGTSGGAGSEFQQRTLSDPHELCEMLERYDDCFGDEVESNCGKDARDFMEGIFWIMKDYFKARHDVVRCPGYILGSYVRQPDSVSKIALAAGIPAALVILVLVICLVVRCRRKPAVQQVKLDEGTIMNHDVFQETGKDTSEQTSGKEDGERNMLT